MNEVNLNSDDLLTENRQFVEILAKKLCKRFSLSNEYYDDMVAEGFLGLVEAASKYKPEMEVPFKNFAFLRIRGSMIDSLRKSSDLSRLAYKSAKSLQALDEIHEETFKQENKATKDNQKEDLARVLNYIAKGAIVYRLNSTDSDSEIANIESKDKNPDEIIEQKNTKINIKKIIEEKLDEKERLIIKEYYFKDKTYNQIIEDNPIFSKSWVSKLHNRAIEKIKEAYVKVDI